MPRRADITPKPAMILAQSARNLGWKGFFGELFDNSFDAGATQIHVDWSSKAIAVRDNGQGCASVEGMLTAGEHRPGRGTRLGRYGIGLKDAAYWVGPLIRVHTVHGGVVHEASVNWARLADWNIDVYDRPAINEPMGTTLTFTNPRRLSTGFESLLAELGHVYAPAIRDGKQVLFSRGREQATLKPFTVPTLEHVVKREWVLASGRRIRMEAGVVPEDQGNPRGGFSIAYQYRVLYTTKEPCGEFSASRFFAWVDLVDGSAKWKLAANKDGIDEDQREELNEALHAECIGLLTLARQQAMHIGVSQFENSVSAKLAGLTAGLRKAKERRSPGTSIGTVDPANSPRRRERASKTQDGDRIVLPRGSLRVEFPRMGTERLCEVDIPSARVSLSIDHPWIKRLVDAGNEDAIVGVALAALLEHDYRNPQLALGIAEGSDERFARGMAELLSKVGGVVSARVCP